MIAPHTSMLILLMSVVLQGIIMAYDSTDRRSFDNVLMWMKDIDKVWRTLTLASIQARFAEWNDSTICFGDHIARTERETVGST